MTIANLRSFYPGYEFIFFSEDKELQRAPFYHSVIKGFRIVSEYTIHIEL